MKRERWLQRLGLAVLSPRCLLCGEPGHAGLDLCLACRQALPWNHLACPQCALPLDTPTGTASPCGHCLQQPPPLHHAAAAFVYGFPLDRLVPRFKFHQDLAAGRLMAQLMAEHFSGCAAGTLVPVPLHPRRLSRRGYDQADQLARDLAQHLALPRQPGLLRRVRDTAAQSELEAEARHRNLRQAFAVPPGQSLPDHVTLVDDVMTTGATLHAAARALTQAGVPRVDAWVCARVA
ncbi:ComF family protein [Pseudoxanthomonas composti]|uniref:ComF family protein n=1 Tax=Pseudoxanthomonas composti TaxID=2137479 RepID=A0A4Q1JXG2_9GAMM|nr:ComF family protein [Pseudoxanthomonas composti]RXR06349.1 ComF family protein [Pseudoxanthomonas composti]